VNSRLRSILLTLLNSSKTQARLDALVDSVKNDSSGLQSLHNQVDNLSRGVTVGSLTPAAQAQLRLLLGMQEHILEVISQKRFLQSLAFDGMHRRYETVDDAHFKTLRWIFDEPLGSATFHESEEKTSAKRLLLKWLSSGSGIFHICGKLGSGKSTLMKYLCDHAKTKSLLKQWAGKFPNIHLLLHLMLRASPTDRERSSSTSFGKFLLLEARFDHAKITRGSHQIVAARHSGNMSRSHKRHLSRPLAPNQVDTLASAI